MKNSHSYKHASLIFLKKIYHLIFRKESILPSFENDADKASEIIFNILSTDQPCMITRFGAVEISALRNYTGILSRQKNAYKFIKGESAEWWWNEGIRYSMTNNAGFFPATDENLEIFGKLMLESIPSIDVLGSWQEYEIHFLDYFPKASLINFIYLDPYWSKLPWTRILAGKKVLVVHPFAELILTQYNEKRDVLFEDKSLLPDFDLKVMNAVQSIGGNSVFPSWFDALKFMEDEIDKIDYDICLLGCGAYGLPLAAHIKNAQKKAVHIGGSLQLLFGIIGKRWENPNYGQKQLTKVGMYPSLINRYWTRPEQNHQPPTFQNVEDGCYW